MYSYFKHYVVVLLSILATTNCDNTQKSEAEIPIKNYYYETTGKRSDDGGLYYASNGKFQACPGADSINRIILDQLFGGECPPRSDFSTEKEFRKVYPNEDYYIYCRVCGHYYYYAESFDDIHRQITANKGTDNKLKLTSMMKGSFGLSNQDMQTYVIVGQNTVNGITVPHLSSCIINIKKQTVVSIDDLFLKGYETVLERAVYQWFQECGIKDYSRFLSDLNYGISTTGIIVYYITEQGINQEPWGAFIVPWESIRYILNPDFGYLASSGDLQIDSSLLFGSPIPERVIYQ